MARAKTNQSKPSMWRNQKALQGLLVIALLFVGTASAVAWQAKKDVSLRQSVIEDNLQLPANLDDVLSVAQIREKAAADQPAGASIMQIELETEEGSVVYKVKFSDGSFRLYDARTGEHFVKNEVAEVDGTVPAGFVAGISLQQARDIAVTQRPGQTVIKIELETEEGAVVYSVRFADGSRVDVNATNGTVVRVKTVDQPSNNSGSSDSSDDSSDGDDSSNGGSGSSGGGSDSSDDNDSSDDSSSGRGSNSGSGSSNDD
ncbi:MAG: PepSY domain-containing protein [Candidatus Saccharibacteria bacterium]|nr:PepSY domain-containing protein [Candidatus Saccharibacteria bacterium]